MKEITNQMVLRTLRRDIDSNLLCAFSLRKVELCALKKVGDHYVHVSSLSRTEESSRSHRPDMDFFGRFGIGSGAVNDAIAWLDGESLELGEKKEGLTSCFLYCYTTFDQDEECVVCAFRLGQMTICQIKKKYTRYECSTNIYDDDRVAVLSLQDAQQWVYDNCGIDARAFQVAIDRIDGFVAYVVGKMQDVFIFKNNLGEFEIFDDEWGACVGKEDSEASARIYAIGYSMFSRSSAFDVKRAPNGLGRLIDGKAFAEQYRYCYES
jgi:hypothetical protein